MSGSSILTGIFKCTNRRILDQEKKKTITYDTELLLGKDENDNDQFINAVLHFFVPKGENEPQEDIYHMVVAKVISIQDNTMVGEDHDVNDFDLELDAFMMTPISGCDEPIPPVITVAGITSQKTDDDFHLKVNQYSSGQMRMTVHIISIDHESQRFQNLPTPKVGSTISATCILTGCGQRTSLQGSLKALPLELREMAFLKEGGVSTKFKGKPSSQLKRSKLNERRQSTIRENSTSDTAPTEGPSSKRLKTSDD